MGHPLLDLTNKTAVVIGGTSGIGLALARGAAARNKYDPRPRKLWRSGGGRLRRLVMSRITAALSGSFNRCAPNSVASKSS